MIEMKVNTVGDPPSPLPPFRSEICLRLKFLHRQDRVSLFKWLIFSMKRELHFATKLNFRDIQRNLYLQSLLPSLREGCSKGSSFTSRIQVHGIKGPRNYNVQPRLVGEGLGCVGTGI